MKNILPLIALSLSASSALIYEVVATNILFFYFVRSSYSIATVLGVFLLGLCIGSALIHLLSNRIANKRLLFGSLQLMIAIYAILVLTNLINIVPSISTLGTFATTFVILIIPTIFLGAVFPLTGLLFKEKQQNNIGIIYSSDLIGAMAGTLFAGFILLPTFGNTLTIIFGASLNLLSAFIILYGKRKLPSLLVLAVLLSLVIFHPIIATEDTDEYQFYANSPYGLITIQQDTLFIDGREQCSTCYPENTSERMMATYALEPLKNQSTLDVLNIGLGCGLTLEEILEYDANADVCEINYQVVLANKIMTNVLTNPRVNLIIDDGLHYLRTTNKRYNSLLIDIENPAVAHSSNLYTVDAFKIISASLYSDGTFTIWNYNGNDRYMKILAYSLKEAFPFLYSYPWVFLASKQQLDQEEYIPQGTWEINTIDKNTLSDAFLGV